MRPRVIVGVDGSKSARSAVRFGADEAMLRGCDLRLLHAFSWPLFYPPLGAEFDPHDRGLRVRMLTMLAESAHDVERDHPHLTVDTRLIDGSPGGVLVTASRDAELLVVGHRGLGGFIGLLAGSVGTQLAGYAHCPVVVVRDEVAPIDAPIVLGVDGSACARSAAEAAFAQAQRRGAELLVVYNRLPYASGAAAEAVAGGHLPPSAVDEVQLSLRGVTERYGDVKFRVETMPGNSAAAALMDTARNAQAGLVVVGSRGIGGFRGLVMGSTSRSLIEHAPCPVLVVPRRVQPRPAGQ
jgi:nucleotide-binding universal stress UspA family protein